MTDRRSYLLALIVALLCAGCMQLSGPGGEGNGSETIARGVITDTSGAPVEGAEVRLIPVSHNPVTDADLPASWQTVTDAPGAYSISDIPAGDYNIEAYHRTTGMRCLIRNIKARGTQSAIALGTDTLRPAGAIKVILPQNALAAYGYAYILGTTRFGRAQNSVALIDSVPIGSTPAVYLHNIADPALDRLVKTGIDVRPGAITSVADYTPWKYSRKLTLNTSASGAGVSGTVTNFPVLVRLSAGNFLFNQAASDGSDLRFSKTDDTPLPFEIERWDAVNSRAEVWVLVDTIKGNNDVQNITMFWGNASAQGISRGAEVFDTANGFRGVWHLADNSARATVKDATGRNDGVMRLGTVETGTSSAYTNGISGGAVNLHGMGDRRWIDLGANKAFINSTREVSISVWMNADSDTLTLNRLINFSTGGTLSSLVPQSRAGIAINTDKIIIEARAQDTGAVARFTSPKTFVSKQWYHIVGLFNVPRDSMYLYVNGELWGSGLRAFNASATDPTNSTSSAIGANDLGNGGYFTGKIDEARIEDTMRSADYIKLSYMNQKAVDALIK